MANELQLYADPDAYSGEAVVARLFQAGVQVGSDISMVEVGVSGNFNGTMPAGNPGVYAVIFYGVFEHIIGQGEIWWNGSREIDWNDVITKLSPTVGQIREFMEDGLLGEVYKIEMRRWKKRL